MKILTIDDSNIHHKHISSLVESLGHEVVGQTTSGAEGINLFKQTKPDIILLDLIMPEMGGIEVLRAIRSMDPHAKVIMVTSVAGVGGQVETAYKLGAADMVSKPVTKENLHNAFERVINQES